MAHEFLKVDVTNGNAALRIDRPQKRNAMTLDMWLELAKIVQVLDEDETVRTVLISGGHANEHFCAGADIAEFETTRKDAKSARIYEDSNINAFSAIRNCSKPTIAMISGFCLGGGFGIAAACDLRFASPDAQFGVPAAKLGLAYPVDAMGDIVASIGVQNAKMLLFTGKRIDANSALSMGFLSEVVPKEKLTQRTIELIDEIAPNAPLSMAAGKLAIRASLTGSKDDIKAAKQLGDKTFNSDDYAEGRAAFKQKRKPVFRGK